MRIRVSYAVEVDDDYRRAINHFYGREGLASRAEVQGWCHLYGTSMDDDIMWALARDDDEGDEQ